MVFRDVQAPSNEGGLDIPGAGGVLVDHRGSGARGGRGTGRAKAGARGIKSTPPLPAKNPAMGTAASKTTSTTATAPPSAATQSYLAPYIGNWYTNGTAPNVTPSNPSYFTITMAISGEPVFNPGNSRLLPSSVVGTTNSNGTISFTTAGATANTTTQVIFSYEKTATYDYLATNGGTMYLYRAPIGAPPGVAATSTTTTTTAPKSTAATRQSSSSKYRGRNGGKTRGR